MPECKIKYPLKFEPVLKQVLWGGNKIIPFLRLEDKTDGAGIPYAELKEVGEDWAVSGVPGFESVVSNGPLKGKPLSYLTENYKEALLGQHNYLRFGNQFPLLVKFIDAAQDLSVQVHPDDELAQKRHSSNGKTEMWYVLDAEKGSGILSGFATAVTQEQYKSMVANQTILKALKRYEVFPGDLFYLPAGRIHGIGAGVFIVEIQQSSDTTYRIYDFDRKDKDGKLRELHTELAVDAIDYSIQGEERIYYKSPGSVSQNVWEHAFEAVRCNYFSTSVIRLENKETSGGLQEVKEFVCDYAHLDSFVILVCTKGEPTLTYTNSCDLGQKITIEVKRGDVFLLPAALASVSIWIKPQGVCEFLETHI